MNSLSTSFGCPSSVSLRRRPTQNSISTPQSSPMRVRKLPLSQFDRAIGDFRQKIMNHLNTDKELNGMIVIKEDIADLYLNIIDKFKEYPSVALKCMSDDKFILDNIEEAKTLSKAVCVAEKSNKVGCVANLMLLALAPVTGGFTLPLLAMTAPAGLVATGNMFHQALENKKFTTEVADSILNHFKKRGALYGDANQPDLQVHPKIKRD